ncbi:MULTISPECIES: capsule biosynthesis protein [unclassified Novosphingobium]|uniref:capsule biosynthesis protein n=1 Tax=unclassified Novosphingobium TaxID=2644732 RepID=UPI00182F8613|nr:MULTISPECIES: capsule biosynthesis protein [unclassified Novosphingobium]NMN03192.1 capsular polysaccharide transport system permease protein [Novosphingobium sp. SG919]NMN86818.1 capsular polysaccharide transport system permease protein [Novosphingobium sp. SG916]
MDTAAGTSLSAGRAWTWWLYKRRWFLVVVGLPTLLAIAYYGFVAADIYVSDSRFVIKSPDRKGPQLSGLAGMVQSSGLSGGHDEASEVVDYVRSRDALSELATRTNVKAAFADPHADTLSRYPAPFEQDSFENLYKFYNSMVTVNLDSDTGIATLSVKAYSPLAAFTLNDNILQISEALVNRLNQRAQDKAIEEAGNRVQKAEQRVLDARIAMRTFRNRQQIIDPEKQAAGTLDIADKFVATRGALQAQYDQIRAKAPRNPALPALAAQIAALDAQIASQNGQAYGSSKALASKLVGYESLMVEQELATENLKSASASLEQARVEAQKQQFYLETVVKPNKPDMPLLPKRLYKILVIFAASVCLYFIGWMLVVGIMEHAPEN